MKRKRDVTSERSTLRFQVEESIPHFIGTYPRASSLKSSSQLTKSEREVSKGNEFCWCSSITTWLIFLVLTFSPTLPPLLWFNWLDQSRWTIVPWKFLPSSSLVPDRTHTFYVNYCETFAVRILQRVNKLLGHPGECPSIELVSCWRGNSWEKPNDRETKSPGPRGRARGLVATHYNVSVDERKEHSLPRLGCAPAVPQWLVKAFAFHFVPLQLSLLIPPELPTRQPLFSRININATSSSLGGFCSSSVPKRPAPSFCPEYFECWCATKPLARSFFSSPPLLLSSSPPHWERTARVHQPRSLMKYDLWIFFFFSPLRERLRGILKMPRNASACRSFVWSWVVWRSRNGYEMVSNFTVQDCVTITILILGETFLWKTIPLV